MIISPSIASSNLLFIAQEIDFVDKYFDHIHIDIEDGVVVNDISFGTKICKEICKRTHSETSIHLEVLNPLDYLDRIAECNPDIVFIQIDHIKDPLRIINEFCLKGIKTGIAISNRDMNRDYSDILGKIEHVLVSTAFHEDKNQLYSSIMQEFALRLADNAKLKVWIDGGINELIINDLISSKIYASVVGRAIFENKYRFIERICKK